MCTKPVPLSQNSRCFLPYSAGLPGLTYWAEGMKKGQTMFRNAGLGCSGISVEKLSSPESQRAHYTQSNRERAVVIPYS